MDGACIKLNSSFSVLIIRCAFKQLIHNSLKCLPAFTDRTKVNVNFVVTVVDHCGEDDLVAYRIDFQSSLVNVFKIQITEFLSCRVRKPVSYLIEERVELLNTGFSLFGHKFLVIMESLITEFTNRLLNKIAVGICLCCFCGIRPSKSNTLFRSSIIFGSNRCFTADISVTGNIHDLRPVSGIRYGYGIHKHSRFVRNLFRYRLTLNYTAHRRRCPGELLNVKERVLLMIFTYPLVSRIILKTSELHQTEYSTLHIKDKWGHSHIEFFIPCSGVSKNASIHISDHFLIDIKSVFGVELSIRIEGQIIGFYIVIKVSIVHSLE